MSIKVKKLGGKKKGGNTHKEKNSILGIKMKLKQVLILDISITQVPILGKNIKLKKVSILGTHILSIKLKEK